MLVAIQTHALPGRQDARRLSLFPMSFNVLSPVCAMSGGLDQTGGHSADKPLTDNGNISDEGVERH